MVSQAHIFNTSPSGKTLKKAAQGGTMFSFGGINSADSNLDNKTPCNIHALIFTDQECYPCFHK